MTPYVSKLGIHCIGPRRKNYGDFLRTIHGYGRRLSLVKCRDDFGAAYEARSYWPDVTTIGAITRLDDVRYDPRVIFNAIVEAARLNPHIEYWEVFNERNGDWDEQADTCLALMPMLEERGLKLCAFNCASGGLPYPSEDGGRAYNNIARVAARAKQGDHMIGLHGYNLDTSDQPSQTGGKDANGGASHTLFRYRHLANFLINQGVLCKIALTEFGPDGGTFIGVKRFIDWCIKADWELMRDHYLIGAALWTLGGGGWQAANFEEALHDTTGSEQVYLDEYLVAVEGVIQPPPPPAQPTTIRLTPLAGDPVDIVVPPGYSIQTL